MNFNKTVNINVKIRKESEKMGSKKLGRPQMREKLKNRPQMNDFFYPLPIGERQSARQTDRDK